MCANVEQNCDFEMNLSFERVFMTYAINIRKSLKTQVIKTAQGDSRNKLKPEFC